MLVASVRPGGVPGIGVGAGGRVDDLGAEVDAAAGGGELVEAGDHDRAVVVIQGDQREGRRRRGVGPPPARIGAPAGRCLGAGTARALRLTVVPGPGGERRRGGAVEPEGRQQRRGGRGGAGRGRARRALSGIGRSAWRRRPRAEEPPPEPPLGGRAPPPFRASSPAARASRCPTAAAVRPPAPIEPMNAIASSAAEDCGRVPATSGTSGTRHRPPPDRPKLAARWRSVPCRCPRRGPGPAHRPAFGPFIQADADRAGIPAAPLDDPRLGGQPHAARGCSAARPMGVTVDS